jgi:hypothetical protein
MNFRIFSACATALLGTVCFSFLLAQETSPAPGEDGEVIIPTEVSEPPYAVGDLVVEQGYYIDRGEGETRINLRLVENKFRLYWIDENGQIAEPEAKEAVVRLTGSVRGRSYHRLSPLPEGAGLGAPGIMVPPHSFNVILYIPAAADRAEVSRSFRYLPSMDTAVDPTQ